MSLIRWKNLHRSLQQEREQFVYLRIPKNPKASARIQKYADPRLIKEWFLEYLPDIFPYEFDIHHDIEIQALQIRGELCVILIFRGSGKTTLAICYLIYSVCYGLDPYIMWIEHDFGEAAKRISLVENVFTSEDYKKLQQDYRVAKGPFWRPGNGELSFRHTSSHACHKNLIVTFAGAREMARGALYDFSRVSLVVFNDVVKDSIEATSNAWNRKVMSMIFHDVMFSGESVGDTSIIYLNTIQAKFDASHRLSEHESALVFKKGILDGDEADIWEFVDYVSSDIPRIKRYIREVKGTPPQLKKKKLTPEDHAVYCQDKLEYQQFFAKLKTNWTGNPNLQLPSLVFEIYNAGSEAFLIERCLLIDDQKLERFKDEWFVPIEDLPFKDVYAKGMKTAMSIDPSAKQEDSKEVNDPQAIVVSLYNPQTRDMYWLYASITWYTPIHFIYEILRILNEPVPLPSCQGRKLKELPRFEILFESNQAQLFGVSLIQTLCAYERSLGGTAEYPEGGEELGHQAGEVRPPAYRHLDYWHLPRIRTRTTTTNKMERIGGKRRRAYFEQRCVHYLPGQNELDLLKTQHLRFKGIETHGNLPKEDKCDGPDACSLLEEYWGVYKEKTTKAPASGKPKHRYIPQQRAVDRYLNRKNA